MAWTMASIRAAMRTPVTGSNLADRFHIPSGSTQVRARTLRRCRARRSRPSSSWSRFVSRSNRRENCSTVPAFATAARASARAINSARFVVSSFLAARVTASMWSAVIAPSSSASASRGVLFRVLERSVDFAALLSDFLDALAMRCSGNDSTACNCDTRAACWASHQACTSRTATRPDSIRSAPGAGFARTPAMRSTRSITPAISMSTTLNRGCHEPAHITLAMSETTKYGGFAHRRGRLTPPAGSPLSRRRRRGRVRLPGGTGSPPRRRSWTRRECRSWPGRRGHPARRRVR